MLNWAAQFDTCCYLDSNGYSGLYPGYDCLAAAGAADILQADAGHAFRQLKDFFELQKDWLFGHFSYDLKNELESLCSEHTERIGFPDLFFFRPRILVILRGKEASIGVDGSQAEANNVLLDILGVSDTIEAIKGTGIHLESRMPGPVYLDKVKSLQAHIRLGDCYEVNFCREFFSEHSILSPLGMFGELNRRSPAPFAAYYKLGDRHLACASPERFLKKKGSRILSQPIKGTAARMPDPLEDARQRKWLSESPKDRAENIMTVDLVRNDLSRVSVENSVRVDELCGVYPFAQVYQMISTVSGELDGSHHWTDAIRCAFPMGSMTGAPKIKVMQLIEEYENSRRGLFSGALGYIDPAGDFDFNVVIRSIFYQASSHYLSFQTGSAITCRSIPDQELEECMLKANILRQVLGSS